MKKSVIGLILVLGLLMASGFALAQPAGPGDGSGWGFGRGGGPCWGGGSGPWGPAFDKDTAKLRGELYQKRLEMRALLAAPQVDEAKLNTLQAETSKMRTELAQKRLSSMVEFKKKNPDWNPGYGPMGGRGMGRGW